MLAKDEEFTRAITYAVDVLDGLVEEGYAGINPDEATAAVDSLRSLIGVVDQQALIALADRQASELKARQ